MEDALREARRLLKEVESSSDLDRLQHLRLLFQAVTHKEHPLLPDFWPHILRFRSTPILDLRLWLLERIEEVANRQIECATLLSFRDLFAPSLLLALLQFSSKFSLLYG